ncbi:MAG: response regulator transcription factor [Candidatus Obscuribacterales bacterium]|nr:response regulator transcription factor [Candidatus Obscuribacterales bacterium]
MSEKITVLVGEHCDFIALGLAALLERQGFTIAAVAKSAETVISLIEEKAPDVALLSMRLPGLKDSEAIKKLRCIAPQLKIVLIAELENTDDAYEALMARAEGLCFKDMDSAQLSSVIRGVHHGGCWIDRRAATQLMNFIQKPPTIPAPVTPPPKVRSGGLSDREREVLQLVVEGLNNSSIATKLCLSIDTVKSHKKRIFEKLEVKDRTEAAVKAIRTGIVQLTTVH